MRRADLLNKPDFLQTRRQWLTGLGATCVGLPWLEASCGSAHAQDAPLRLVVFFSPNGTIPKNFWPNGSETDFSLSPILSPLAAHKDSLLVLGGLDNIVSKMGPGDAHQKGMGSCITGSPLLEGEFQGMGGQIAGWASQASFDQYIAEALSPPTKFKSLEFGVGIEGAHVGTRLAYAGANRPIPPQTDPYGMFSRIFGSEEASSRSQRRRALVLDRVRSQYERLHGRLGKRDQERLQSHVESIQAIEAQLRAPDIVYSDQCTKPVLASGLDPKANDQIPKVGRVQMDLLASALACDATRVSTLMYTHSVSTAIYSWLSAEVRTKSYAIRDGHHDIAHKGNEEEIYVAQNTAINTYLMGELAYLVDQLKARPEGDGSVFDRTIIMYVNEHATGNDHRREDMPYLLIAGSKTGLATARYLRFAPKLADRATGQRGLPHNRLLASMIEAMGVDPGPFAAKEVDSSPLPNLRG